MRFHSEQNADYHSVHIVRGTAQLDLRAFHASHLPDGRT